MQSLLTDLHHRDTATAVGIERTVLAGLAGGCSLPLGCFARRHDGRWQVRIRLGRDHGLCETALTGWSWDLPQLAANVLRQQGALSA